MNYRKLTPHETPKDVEVKLLDGVFYHSQDPRHPEVSHSSTLCLEVFPLDSIAIWCTHFNYVLFHYKMFNFLIRWSVLCWIRGYYITCLVCSPQSSPASLHVLTLITWHRISLLCLEYFVYCFMYWEYILHYFSIVSTIFWAFFVKKNSPIVLRTFT